MTMTINVTIPEDDVRGGFAAEYLSCAMSAIGYSRGVTLPMPEDAAPPAHDYPASEPTEEPKAAAQQEEQPVRERGKPSPGKARRTKEEMEEDEAADKADAEAAEKAAADKPAISTGDERIDPTTEADAAQDKADEAAEAETTKSADLTAEDVRAALKKYMDAYGQAAVMEDAPKVFAMMFGEGTAKVSDVPTDQASLQKAIAGIEEMRVKNPFKRTPEL